MDAELAAAIYTEAFEWAQAKLRMGMDRFGSPDHDRHMQEADDHHRALLRALYLGMPEAETRDEFHNILDADKDA